MRIASGGIQNNTVLTSDGKCPDISKDVGKRRPTSMRSPAQIQAMTFIRGRTRPSAEANNQLARANRIRIRTIRQAKVIPQSKSNP